MINIRTSKRNGKVVSAFLVKDDTELIIITERGKIVRLEAASIRQTISRGTQGVKLIDLGENDKVADITLIPEEEEKTQIDE